MNLCNDNHDEICYEGRDCPVCSLRTSKDQDITEKDSKIDALTDEREALKDEVSRLKIQVEELTP